MFIEYTIEWNSLDLKINFSSNSFFNTGRIEFLLRLASVSYTHLIRTKLFQTEILSFDQMVFLNIPVEPAVCILTEIPLLEKEP